MWDNLEQENLNNETPDNQENSQTDQKELRHAQQLEWSRKEVEKMVDVFVDKVWKDATILYDIQETDPKLANRIAKKFGYTDSKEALSSYEQQNQPEWKRTMEEDFDALYKQRRDRERHEEALEEVNQKINSLDEESKEEVRQTFKELTEGKTLTNKNAIKFLEMATLYSGKWRKDIYNDTLSDLHSIGISKTNKQVEKKKTTMTVGKLNTMQMPKEEQKRLYPELF